MAFQGTRDNSFIPHPTTGEMINPGDNFQKGVPLCGESSSDTAQRELEGRTTQSSFDHQHVLREWPRSLYSRFLLHGRHHLYKYSHTAALPEKGIRKDHQYSFTYAHSKIWLLIISLIRLTEGFGRGGVCYWENEEVKSRTQSVPVPSLP